MIVTLEITGLTKVFDSPSGSYVAVKNVNAKIRESEFVCILGHSGCGKSTVLSIMAGLQQATFCGVVINGKEVCEPGTDRGVVFQSPCLLPWLTAGENVTLAAGRAFPKCGHSQRKEQAERYLELLGIPDCYRQMPAQLSLGTQQCVSLARALSLEPKLLLLDEPAAGMNHEEIGQLRERILQLRSRGITIVLVEHVMELVMGVTDRIAVLNFGQKIAEGSPAAIQSDPLVKKAYLGGA